MPFEQHPTDPNKVIMRAGKYKIPKPWVGLTWEDMPEEYAGDSSFLSGARWAEAKLKERNHD
jgi:hypothetical protein